MERDNRMWVAQLSATGAEQQAALQDLRGLLLRALRHALRGQRRQFGDAFLEDAVQEALLRILDRLSQFEGRSRFVTWAASIAIRVAMTEVRRKRFKDVSLDELLAATPVTSLVASPVEESDRSERREIVEKMYQVLRDDLTEKQRTVILAELRGLPQAEIAKHFSTNRNALYKLGHDARRRLKRGLEQAGFDAPYVQAALEG